MDADDARARALTAEHGHSPTQREKVRQNQHASSTSFVDVHNIDSVHTNSSGSIRCPLKRRDSTAFSKPTMDCSETPADDANVPQVSNERSVQRKIRGTMRRCRRTGNHGIARNAAHFPKTSRLPDGPHRGVMGGCALIGTSAAFSEVQHRRRT